MCKVLLKIMIRRCIHASSYIFDHTQLKELYPMKLSLCHPIKGTLAVAIYVMWDVARL